MEYRVPATFLIPEWLIELGIIELPVATDPVSAAFLPREEAHGLLSALHVLIRDYVLLGYTVEGVLLARTGTTHQTTVYFDLLYNTYLVEFDVPGGQSGSWEAYTGSVLPFGAGPGAALGLYVTPWMRPQPDAGTYAAQVQVAVEGITETYSVAQPGWLMVGAAGDEPSDFGAVLDQVASLVAEAEAVLDGFVNAYLDEFIKRADPADTTGVGMMFTLHNGNWVQDSNPVFTAASLIYPGLKQKVSLRALTTTLKEPIQQFYDVNNVNTLLAYNILIGSIANEVYQTLHSSPLGFSATTRDALFAASQRAQDMTLFEFLVFAHETTVLDILGERPTTPLLSPADAAAEHTPFDVTGFYEMENGDRDSTLQLNQAGRHIQGYWQARLDSGAAGAYKYQYWYVVGWLEGVTGDTFTFKLAYERLSDDYFTTNNPDHAPSLQSLLIDWDSVTETLVAERVSVGGATEVRCTAHTVDGPFEFKRLHELPHASDADLAGLLGTAVYIGHRIPLHTDDLPVIAETAAFLKDMADRFQNTSGDIAALEYAFCVENGASIDGTYYPSVGSRLARFAYWDNTLRRFPNRLPIAPSPGHTYPPPNKVQLPLVQLQIRHILGAMNSWPVVMHMLAMARLHMPRTIAYLGVTEAELDAAEESAADRVHRYEWRVVPFRGDSWNLGINTLSALVTTARLAIEAADALAFGFGVDITLFRIEIRKLNPPGSPQPYAWTEEFLGGWGGGSVGLSIGAVFEQTTSWSTLTSFYDWQPANFTGQMSLISLVVGAALAPYNPFGYMPSPVHHTWSPIATVTFYGDGTHPEVLSGDASGLSWVASGAFAGFELGGVWGYMWWWGDLKNLPSTPSPEVTSPLTRTQIKTGDAQNFEVDGYTLNAEARQMVREFAATYRLNMQNPRASLSVKGHTSSSGPFAYNMALSQKRAQFTYEFLEAILGSGLKIPERNLLVRGYGESEALQATGEDVESAYHRRVDMELNGTTLLAIGSSQ